MKKIHLNINQNFSCLKGKGIRSKIILLIIIPFLFIADSFAQSSPAPSPKALLLDIKKSNPDINRISLQLKVAAYYLFWPGANQKNVDTAIIYYSQAAQLSNKLHDVDNQYNSPGLTGNFVENEPELERYRRKLMQAVA